MENSVPTHSNEPSFLQNRPQLNWTLLPVQLTRFIAVWANWSRSRAIRAVDMHTELHVIDFVIEYPSVYLSEVCYNIHDITGEAVSPSTVCRLLKQCGISRKKIRQVTLQRCDSLRGAFMAQTFLLSTWYVLLERWNWFSNKGCHPKAWIFFMWMRAEYHRLLTRGKRVNAITAISSTGIIALELTTDTVNGDKFFWFSQSIINPKHDGI